MKEKADTKVYILYGYIYGKLKNKEAELKCTAEKFIFSL